MDTKENAGNSQKFIIRIFILFVIMLMTLPFVNSFNSFLTNIFLKWQYYKVLEEVVVPYEAKLVSAIFSSLGLGSNAVSRGVWVNGTFLEIQWNCLGWQSAVLLGASLLGGFQKSYSWFSRTEVVLIGFLGTFLVNIFRLFFVGILTVNIGSGVAIFFHDYLALLMLISWFVFFWWFSYSFVLEETKE